MNEIINSVLQSEDRVRYIHPLTEEVYEIVHYQGLFQYEGTDECESLWLVHKLKDDLSNINIEHPDLDDRCNCYYVSEEHLIHILSY